MPAIRLTEERLRNHLDSRQPEQEGMCLALLPLIGNYLKCRPRRPKGGPDGGRDIEALLDDHVLTFAAVGIKNGGGRDTESRNATARKFKEDLARALKEIKDLKSFVFFTNVDLTPSGKEELQRTAKEKGVETVVIVDFETLRNLLDSAEGLIARLQYLDIEMTKEEQLSLVSKFGIQIQEAISHRLDRVEATLADMQRFMDFQKPLFRVDNYLTFTEPRTSHDLGPAAFIVQVRGLTQLGQVTNFYIENHVHHSLASENLVTRTNMWHESQSKFSFENVGGFIGRDTSTMASSLKLNLELLGTKVLTCPH